LGSEREGEERVEVRIFAEKRRGTRKCGSSGGGDGVRYFLGGERRKVPTTGEKLELDPYVQYRNEREYNKQYEIWIKQKGGTTGVNTKSTNVHCSTGRRN
jgi:hypothetical protein